MASATYVKFMTKEELVKMLMEIHRFSIKTKDGKIITLDNRKEKAEYQNYRGIQICYRPPMFKLTAFDYEDVLLYGEGYVRYNTFLMCNDSPQAIILREEYGFTRED